MKIICSVNSTLSVDSICLIYCKLLLKKFLWCPKERSINLQFIMSVSRLYSFPVASSASRCFSSFQIADLLGMLSSIPEKESCIFCSNRKGSKTWEENNLSGVWFSPVYKQHLGSLKMSPVTRREVRKMFFVNPFTYWVSSDWKTPSESENRILLM